MRIMAGTPRMRTAMDHAVGDEGATSSKIFISPKAPSTQTASLMISGARHARRSH